MTPMKSDASIQHEFVTHLNAEPSVDAARVAAWVHSGVLSLCGHIETTEQKEAIVRLAFRIEGVRAVAVGLVVTPDKDRARDDSDIALGVAGRFAWNDWIPAESIAVRVEKGWVTVTGEVEREYQCANLSEIVRAVEGVAGVTCNIALKPAAASQDAVDAVRAAICRHAQQEAADIDVLRSGDTLILRGQASSWKQRSAAVAAAWKQPGVQEVDDQIHVVFDRG